MRRDPGEIREVLFGIHPIVEALESGRRTVDRVLVSREGASGLGRLLRLAREAGVPVTHLPKDLLARKTGTRVVHQGVAALVSAVPYADPEALCRSAVLARGILLVLDGITDPRNLGAILRTAAAAGVAGVLLGEGDTVGLTPVVAKAAAGATDRIGVAREPRLARRLQSLRSERFKVVALDGRGEVPWDRAELTGGLVLIGGGEGSGLRRGLRDAADQRVAIPLAAGVESLNVSVAMGIVLFEALRQRRGSAC